MNTELKEILKTAALDNLAQRAGITSEQIQESRDMLYMTAQTQNPMPMAMPEPPMDNPMQRPMNVMPGDPQRMANMQNIKQALSTESPLDNIAMMRMAQRPQGMAGGGGLSEFSGRVPGDGHGMEDNVYMPIVDNGEQVATLAVSPDEYVVDAHTMSALGNGNADAGADVMDQIVREVRQEAYGTTKQPNQINGLQSLRNKMIG
jgi:hypothetical protein